MFHGGGRVVRSSSINFQCRGVLLVWMIVGQGPIALAVGTGGGDLDIFILLYLFSFLSPSVWETARYRLKYCLKGPLNQKQQQQYMFHFFRFIVFSRRYMIEGGGRVVRRCWVNFQCWGVLLIWIIVGQGPIALAVGAGGGCLDIFLSSITSLFFLPLSGRRPDID